MPFTLAWGNKKWLTNLGVNTLLNQQGVPKRPQKKKVLSQGGGDVSFSFIFCILNECVHDPYSAD